VWIGWFIHVIVHIYPICSAFYVLAIEGFNNTGYGYCLLSNAPLGCEEYNSNVICERGPDTQASVSKIQWFFIAPDIFFIIFPTVVMVILYLKVRRQQVTIRIQACTVAFQSMIYLGDIYFDWSFYYWKCNRVGIS